MPFRLAFASVLSLVIIAAAVTAREWTDNRGRKVKGEFERIEDGKVVIKNRGGTVSVPFEKLSVPDQKIVRNLLEERGQSNLLPKPSPPTSTDSGAPSPPHEPMVVDPTSSGPSIPPDSTDFVARDPVDSSGLEIDAVPSGSAADSMTREWRDINGNTWTASYTQVKNGEVYFRTPQSSDSKESDFRFPFAQLSEDDQSFLRSDLMPDVPEKRKEDVKKSPDYRPPAWAFAIFGISVVILLIALMIKTLDRLSSKTA